ncbi:4179_t:CDS:2, partial [Dentiscutata heterogama]
TAKLSDFGFSKFENEKTRPFDGNGLRTQENKVKFLRDCYAKTFDPDAYLSNNEIENIQEFIRNLLPGSHSEEFSQA